MVGLSFFNRPIFGYLFGILAIGGIFWWFFTSSDRNVPNPRLEEGQLLGWSTLAFASAIVFTLVVCSLVKKWRLGASEGDEPSDGLEVLQRMTYFRAIGRHFRRRKGEG